MQVLNELTEYARDVVHPNMAREAVRAVGRIALGVSVVLICLRVYFVFCTLRKRKCDGKYWGGG